VSEYDYSRDAHAVERISTVSHMFGSAAGWQDAAKHVRAESGRRFAVGLDDESVVLRRMADELDGMAAQARKKAEDANDSRAEWAVLESAWVPHPYRPVRRRAAAGRRA
jgi:hypothetical protein